MFLRGERSVVVSPLRDQHATPCPTFLTNPAGIEPSFSSPMLKDSLTRSSHRLFLSGDGIQRSQLGDRASRIPCLFAARKSRDDPPFRKISRIIPLTIVAPGCRNLAKPADELGAGVRLHAPQDLSEPALRDLQRAPSPTLSQRSDTALKTR